MLRALLALSSLTLVACSLSDLPKDFVFGTGTADYQIEGAVAEDGREPSIWDIFAHTPGKTANGGTGDVADNSYHMTDVDVQLMKDMNLPAYRFAISWSRLIHADGSVNPLAVDHYNRLIDLLLKNNIEPYVTLYHWTLPAAYSTFNGRPGWLNASYITPLFTHYADVVFSSFGDRVKNWFTFNEPLTFCILGFESGVHAPGRCSDRSKCSAGDSIREPYECVHSVNLAHVHTMELYRTKYAKNQNGKVGITLNINWAEPATDSAADRLAAQQALEWDLGAWADPIYHGDYNDLMKERAGKLLPSFTDDEKKMFMNNLPDYFGLNFYTSSYAYAQSNPAPPQSGWSADRNVTSSATGPDGKLIGPATDSPWLFSTPWGIKKMVHWIADRYPGYDIYVTENGMDVINETIMPMKQALHDPDRINFVSEYLSNIGEAIAEGVPVKGYFLWSALDNYEWADSYTKRFGIHYVDYNNDQARYPKDSAKWYASLIKNVTGHGGYEKEFARQHVIVDQ